MKCFNCGEPGHKAFECQRETLSTQRPAGFTAATRRTAKPPTDDYLTALAELGIVRDADGARVLAVTCPWCQASPRQRCANRALGTETHFHEKRYEAAGLEPPRRPVLADIARRQVDELREQRAKSETR